MTADPTHLLTSTDVAEKRIERLRELFPEAFTDGGIDFDRLRVALGAQVDEAPERFGLGWAGKADAIRAAQTLSTATLLPAPNDSVNWDGTENLLIEGDNLEVLKLLQKSYHGRVKVIYIDPPYNTGRDFIYADNFRDGLRSYLRFTGQTDEAGVRLSTNPETGGRFHSRWLSMMYPRLALARDLLRDDGFIAVSIGDEELANLRLLLNEIFGEENHRNTIAVRRYDKNLSRQFMDRGLPSLAVGFEYVLVYSRTPDATMNPVFREASEERQRRGYWKGFWNAADRPTMRYPLFGFTPETGQWKWKEETALEAVAAYQEYEREHAATKSLEEFWEETDCGKRFIRHNPGGRGMNRGVEHWVPPSSGILRTSNWTDLLASQPLGDLPFDNPKNPALLAALLRLLSDETGLVLDFFAGSGTTAAAVLDVNRADKWRQRFLLAQLPEPLDDPDYPSIAAVTRERVRRAIAELGAGGDGAGSSQREGEDLGFRVFTLAPSNFRLWNADKVPTDTDGLAEQLRLHIDHLREDRSEREVLWEILLKAGLPLSARVEEKTLAGETVFVVQEGRLLVCLASRLAPATLRTMADAGAERIVVLDHAFARDDALKTNTALEMKASGIDFRTV